MDLPEIKNITQRNTEKSQSDTENILSLICMNPIVYKEYSSEVKTRPFICNPNSL